MDVASLLLRVTGDASDAKRALTEVRTELQAMSSKEYAADVKVYGIEAARAHVDSLQRSLTVIGQRNVTAKVKVDIGDAQAKIAVLRAELDLAARGGPGARPIAAILGDLGKVGDDVERLGRRTGFLSGVLHAVKGAATDLASSGMAILSTAVKSVLTTLISFGIYAAILIPILLALLGVIGALAASFAAAAAGAVFIGVAFVGTLVPALAVLIATFVKLAQVVKAAKEQQQKEADAADKVASAREALSAANRRVTDANDGVADAQERLRAATTSAWQAYHDSIETVKNDLLDVQYAQLGVEQANLTVKKTAQALKDALGEAGSGARNLFKQFTDVDFQPGDTVGALKKVGVSGDKALDIEQLVIDHKRALIDEDKALNTVRETRTKLNRDRATEADYLKRGIIANEGYRSALKGVETAERSVGDAVVARDKAERALANSLRDQNDVLKNMNPQTEKLAEQYEKIKNRVADVFGPIAEKVLGSAIDAADDFTEALSDDGVKGGLDGIGDALGDFLKQLGKLANSRGGREFFAQMANGAAELIKQLGSRAGIAFLRLLARIASETLPYLLRGVRRIADAFEGWEEGTRSGNRIQRLVRSLVGSLRDWLGLIRSIARVFLAFFGDAKEDGDSFVKTLTRMFNRLADFLNTDEGRARVKKWIKDSVDLVKDLGKAFHAVYETVKLLIDVIKTLKNLIENSPIGLLVKTLAGGAGAAAGGAGPGGILGGAAAGAKGGVKGFLKHLIPGGDILGSIFGFARGGLIPPGDDQVIGARSGEYMIQQAAVDSLGVDTLDLLNMGVPIGDIAARTRGGDGATYGDVKVVLPPAPAAAVPDARYQAVQLGKELSRRGG